VTIFKIKGAATRPSLPGANYFKHFDTVRPFGQNEGCVPDHAGNFF
jgi:hypothetical protein